jgi:glycosyltransferase involved in cell wall biosynthesis
MSNLPLVSIIMPLYNKARYVRRAINSVREQTYSNWELVVVDDGSTDHSVVQVPSNHNRIQIIRQQRLGPAAARNRGIKQAQGAYVAFLDADDFFYPFKIETEVNLLWENRFAKWMISPFHRKSKSIISAQYLKDNALKNLKGPPKVFDCVLKDLSIVNWAIDGLFIKKALIQKIGGFNETMHCYENTEFFIRCALIQPRILAYTKPLFCVNDVPMSAFKHYGHTISGNKQIGDQLCKLSKQYPHFFKQLKTFSQSHYFSYTRKQIINGAGKEARRFLIHQYPYSKTKSWWIWWLFSLIPATLLHTSLAKSYLLNR